MTCTAVQTILLIENDRVTLNLYLKGLQAKGFNVIGVENGLVGIQQIQEYLPDLVIYRWLHCSNYLTPKYSNNTYSLDFPDC
ncbi:MAG: hypothetical protein V7K89_05805 [Nostoc sp.]|uniref:hypothetical protein n=1 Tax=Nostoc sp. TaxID=1180 RepID=UPI002FF8FCC9